MSGFDEPDDEPRYEDATCAHCGVTDLTWVHTGKGWRLVDEKGLHVCSNERAADDFEVLG